MSVHLFLFAACVLPTVTLCAACEVGQSLADWQMVSRAAPSPGFKKSMTESVVHNTSPYNKYSSDIACCNCHGLSLQGGDSIAFVL